MSSNSPIFPILHSYHFNDYGFESQIHYFQVMEEARKHKIEASTKSSINTLHFKLQKSISKDDIINNRSSLHKRKSRWWWNNSFPFFKWKKRAISTVHFNEDRDLHRPRHKTFRSSMSGPIYATESLSGSSTPYRTTTSRPSSGPIAGTVTPTRKDDLRVPYLSLRELNMEQQQRISTSSLPIYLVT